MILRERVLQKARELFFRYGIKSITMDEIASQLGVSKKTIYHFFEDKDGIVQAIVHNEIAYLHEQCEKHRHNSENAVEEVFEFMQSVESLFEILNPLMLYDLEKFYPDTYAIFLRFKNSFLLETIRLNLLRGREEALFRSDIHVDIMTVYRLEISFLPLKQNLFPFGKYSVLQVSNEVLYHFMLGICTEKGKKLVDQHLELRKIDKILV